MMRVNVCVAGVAVLLSTAIAAAGQDPVISFTPVQSSSAESPISSAGIARLLGNAAAPPAPRLEAVPTGMSCSSSAPICGNMTYHGGQVQHPTQKVYTIFWNGPGALLFTTSYIALNNQFVQDLNGSGLYGVAQEYGDGSGNIAGVSLAGTWVDTTNSVPTDPGVYSALLAEVNRAITANGWTPDANSYFQVFTPPGIGFNAGYCGFHTASSAPIYTFGLILFPGSHSGGTCLIGGTTPNGTTTDSAISVSSHEILETATDPYFNGWYFQNGSGEIGDLCAWDFGTQASDGSNVTMNGHKYLAQREYSNALSGCTLGSATPVCTYSLSSSGASSPYFATSGVVTLSVSPSTCTWQAASNASFLGVSPANGTGSATLTYTVQYNPSTAPRSGTITIAAQTFTIVQAGLAANHRPAPFDFDGNGTSDISIFRPDGGIFYILNQPLADWGSAGDIPVPADYDGDGRPNFAIYRPGNGTWYIAGVGAFTWGLPGDIPVPADYNGDGITDIAVFRPSTGTWFIRNVATISWGLAGDIPVPGDYNGDRITDVAVFRPSSGTWYIRNLATIVWGQASDIPVPADYDGNGTTDIGVFRRSNGTWYVKDQFTQMWGGNADVPVLLDRDGDGRTELGIFRRASGTWFFRNQATAASEIVSFGRSGDIPLGAPPLAASHAAAGSFDGDRLADLTIFRPSTGDWASLRSVTNGADYIGKTWGLSSDVLVPGDYDGDGKTDFAVFRPSNGMWYALLSSTGNTNGLSQAWGLSSDTPVPGDYDGDGKTDFAVFRPSEGRWFVLLSSSGYANSITIDCGQPGDTPVPADYDGDGRTDPAVFRPSTGQWFVLDRFAGTTATYAWGLSGDTPAAADFDGDGKADIVVFRPSQGRWYIKSSIDGSSQVIDWGLSTDQIVPADYDGDGKADVAVFRPSTAMWYVRGLFNRTWGAGGDVGAVKNP